MEDIKKRIEKVTNLIKEAEKKKKEIEEDIRRGRITLGKLNSQLNAELNVRSGEFYLKFCPENDLVILVVIYVNKITEDGLLDATLYRFFGNMINIETDVICAPDLEETRVITVKEWRNYFMPLILGPSSNLASIVECIKKAYTKDDVYKLECFGTGQDMVRRGTNPYTLEELLIRQGYTESKNLV